MQAQDLSPLHGKTQTGHSLVLGTAELIQAAGAGSTWLSLGQPETVTDYCISIIHQLKNDLFGKIEIFSNRSLL